jgi:hypothetical protein
MLRKAEHRFEQQSKQTQSALKDSLERAKKAEVNLLEFKLEIGIKLLVRAQEDCQNNIKQLDDLSRRYVCFIFSGIQSWKNFARNMQISILL